MGLSTCSLVDLAHNLSRVRIDRCGPIKKGRHVDVLVASLDFSHVGMCPVDLFRELALAEALSDSELLEKRAEEFVLDSVSTSHGSSQISFTCDLALW